MEVLLWFGAYLLGAVVSAYVIARFLDPDFATMFGFFWPIGILLAAYVYAIELGEEHAGRS